MFSTPSPIKLRPCTKTSGKTKNCNAVRLDAPPSPLGGSKKAPRSPCKRFVNGAKTRRAAALAKARHMSGSPISRSPSPSDRSASPPLPAWAPLGAKRELVDMAGGSPGTPRTKMLRRVLRDLGEVREQLCNVAESITGLHVQGSRLASLTDRGLKALGTEMENVRDGIEMEHFYTRNTISNELERRTSAVQAGLHGIDGLPATMAHGGQTDGAFAPQAFRLVTQFQPVTMFGAFDGGVWPPRPLKPKEQRPGSPIKPMEPLPPQALGAAPVQFHALSVAGARLTRKTPSAFSSGTSSPSDALFLSGSSGVAAGVAASSQDEALLAAFSHLPAITPL